jgi:transposase-like protein
MVHKLGGGPYCQSEQIVKRGKTDTGKQHYRCQKEQSA